MQKQLRFINNRAEIYDYEYPTNFYGDIEYLLRHAQAFRHPSILELGAGTGRVSYYLSGKGYDVTMVDNDSDMIKVMNRKSRLLGDGHGKVTIINGSMVNYVNKGSFDMIVLTGNTFTSLLTQDDQLNTLKNIQKNLTSTGIAIIHIHLPNKQDGMLNEFQFSYNFTDDDGFLYKRYVMEIMDVNNEYLIYNFLYRIFKGSLFMGEFSHSVTTKIVSRPKMTSLLYEAGLNVNVVNDGFADVLANGETTSVVYVAGKN